MLRGSSIGATRFCKNLRMRWPTLRSSCCICRSAASVNSIVQAKTLCDLVQGVGSLSTRPNPFQNPLGLIGIFQVLNMLQDCLAGIISLGASTTLCQTFKPLFNRLRKADCQHKTPRYINIANGSVHFHGPATTRPAILN